MRKLHYLDVMPEPRELHLALRRITLLEDWVERVVPHLDAIDERLLVEDVRPVPLGKLFIEFLATGLVFSLGALLGCKIWRLF